MLILFYVLDSLRRDFLGCYGDAGALTPNLDRFAARATRFTQAYAPAPWSKPSGAAMLTGRLPRALGLRSLLGRLPTNVPTLPEQLSAAGYRTVAVSGNPFISHDFGLLRAFDTTIEAFRPGVLPGETFLFHENHFRRVAGSLSVEAASLVLARSPALHQALLDVLPDGAPTFALCWSMDTHAPFFVRGARSLFGNSLARVIPAADPEWLQGGVTVRDIVSLYRDMVAYNDASLGELFASLQARGLWDDALIVVMGDHGEAFGEHGLMGHSNGLWEEQIGVPLLIKWPRQREATSCDVPVSLVDLAPTVQHLLGLPDWEGDGISLQASLSDAPPLGRALLLETAEGWGLRLDDWKAIAPTDEATPLLFNLRTDRDERRPLADESLRRDMASHAARLRAGADLQAAHWATSTPEDDPLVLQRLRDLGYL